MQTPKLDEIAKVAKELKVDINRVRENPQGGTIGTEQYTHKELLDDLERLVDIAITITDHPELILQFSQLNDRQNIFNGLNSSRSHLSNLQHLYNSIGSLRVHLRPYIFMYLPERSQELQKEIQDLQALKSKVLELFSLTKENKEGSDELWEKVDERSADIEKKWEALLKREEEIDLKITRIQEKLDEQEQTQQEVDSLAEQIQEKKDTSSEAHEEIIQKREVINNFLLRIEQSEQRLDGLGVKSDNYEKKLEDYTSKREKQNKEIQSTINDAKKALGFSTATGLSAAFKTEYDAYKKKPLWLWIVFSFLWIAVTIVLGVWITQTGSNAEPESQTWYLIIGRVLLLPISLAGAAFCGKQYVNEKNLREDYRYKMVLAQSLTGFSGEINKQMENYADKEYVNYLRLVLGEIHKDPIRFTRQKKGAKEEDTDEIKSTGEIEKILEKLEGLSEKVEELTGPLSGDSK